MATKTELDTWLQENHRLMRWYANRYRNVLYYYPEMSFEDLVQEANIIVIRAWDEWLPDMGASRASFYGNHIEWRYQTMIRLSKHDVRRANIEALRANNGENTIGWTNTDSDSKDELNKQAMRVDSFENLIDQHMDAKALLRKNLAKLPKRHGDILVQYYATDVPNMQTIGNQYGISRERVRQIRDEALRILRGEQYGVKKRGPRDPNAKK